jgi:hypothetical protein
MRQPQYCASCQKLKSPDEFPNPDKYKPVCYLCGSYTTRRNRKRVYGINHDDVLILIQQSGEACMICKEPFGKDQVCVDHDHVSGKIRGVLCRMCNTGLGHFKDDPIILSTAIQYLEAN